MNINWQVVGHTTVGIIIAGSQAVAMAYSANTEVVSICHTVALLAAQIGASLGVWTVSQAVSTKRLAAISPCPHCGKLQSAPVELPKAA